MSDAALRVLLGTQTALETLELKKLFGLRGRCLLAIGTSSGTLKELKLRRLYDLKCAFLVALFQRFKFPALHLLAFEYSVRAVYSFIC